LPTFWKNTVVAIFRINNFGGWWGEALITDLPAVDELEVRP
jgi:hypothetical protein